MGRLIRFDKRGTGMSDRPPGLPDLETRMHDVLAVMDAVGSRPGGARRLLRGRCRWRSCWPRRTPSGSARWCCTAATPSATWSPDYPWAQTQEAPRGLHRSSWSPAGTGRPTACVRCPSADVRDAAVVGAADASRRDAVHGAGADGHELAGRRAGRAARRPASRRWCCTASATGMFRRRRMRSYIAEHIPGARLELLDGDDHFVLRRPRTRSSTRSSRSSREPAGARSNRLAHWLRSSRSPASGATR